MIITQLLAIIAAITGGVATLFAFYKKVLKPLVKTIIRIKTTLDIIEKLDTEFKPNGGGSLRDAINRIEISLLVEQQTRRVMSMALDVGFFESDEKGMCLWVNRFYTHITGLTPAEAKNYGWVTSVDSEDREQVIEEWRSAIEQKRNFQMTYRIVNTKTGERRKIKCDSFPICNEKDEIVGHTGVITPLS